MTFQRFLPGLGALAAAATFAACSGTTDKATEVASGVAAVGPSAATDPSTTADCTLATRNPAKVVCLANAFKATLSTSQIASLQLAYTSANATTWSNLPVSAATRIGIRFDALSATQRAAALNLAKAALGSAGYATFNSIRAADAYLAANGGNSGPGGPGGGLSYGDTLYFVSILGTPSTTSPWILKFDGHHFAVNLHYNGTQAPTATPHFIGTEPQAFTLNGVTYAPLQQRKVYLYSMINSLDATQAAAAQISGTFNDVLLGPGQDGRFPTTRQGIAYSALNATQQGLVRQAIQEWVNIQPSNEASTTTAAYFSDAALANTTVGWAGSRDSTVSGSYIRIDGPRVWIEFACQTGIVFRNQIHFHTIWRDRQYDYGGDFTF